MRGQIPGVDDALIKEDYYHGLIAREDVPDLLKTNGQFLLRTTEPSTGMAQSVVISVMFDDEQPASKSIKHFVIRQDNMGLFHCERKSYQTIQKLVEAYINESIPLDGLGTVTMRTPLARKTWEMSPHQVQVGQKLGEGAYGEVCKGKVKGKNAAIKLNHMGKLNKDQIKEVMAEARIMRRAQSPNIIKFLGIMALDEPLLITMELATASLDSYLQKHGNSVTNLKKTIMCQELSWALCFLETLNILHRDLAARNCLLVDDVVKLSDFGKSQRATNFKMDPKEKLPIRWLAPETMTHQIFTFATEVWSFGIVCWEIFANGQEPYTGMMVREVNEKVVAGWRMDMPSTTPEKIKTLVERRIWAPADQRININMVAEYLQGITGLTQTTSERAHQAGSQKQHKSKKSDKSSKKGPSGKHHSKHR